jgi:hypothetical protein
LGSWIEPVPVDPVLVAPVPPIHDPLFPLHEAPVPVLVPPAHHPRLTHIDLARQAKTERASRREVQGIRIAGGECTCLRDHLTGIVFGEIRSSENRFKSHIDPTGLVRPTIPYIS